MIVEFEQLPDAFSEEPTCGLRWVYRLDATGSAVPVLQQQFKRTRFVGPGATSIAQVFDWLIWRDVPTGSEHEGPSA